MSRLRAALSHPGLNNSMPHYKISEGIAHIEDLNLDEFIAVLKNLPQFQGFEKLDGANLWFGLDGEGKLFTSREGKRSNADRKYKVSDWAMRSNLDQFRAAHAALLRVEEVIVSVLQPDDTVEAEVMFGNQPNTVSYGTQNRSFLAILRGVNDTADDRVQTLSNALSGKSADVKIEVLATDDGEKLRPFQFTTSFEFITAPQIDAERLKISEVEKSIEKLEAFLSSDSTISGFTNGELISVSLNQIPMEKRDAVKQARSSLVAAIESDFKLPIKQQLLNKLVRNTGSKLTDPQDKNAVDIEGVVLRDPVSGRQVKVVDKDLFTVMNKFNQSARARIQSALSTTNPDASLESRGGLLGELRIRIAQVLGNRELAKASNLRKIAQSLKGETASDTVKALAASLNIDDFQELKLKTLAIISSTSKQLKTELEVFKKQKGEFKLKLKDGKEVKLSPETIKKTLVNFAEAKANLQDLFNKIKNADDLPQFLAVMYGGIIKGVQTANIAEELITERKNSPKKKKNAKTASLGEIDLMDFQGKEAFALVNGYLATIFLTMFIFQNNDAQGLRILRDRKNYRLTRWAHDMSPLNHWGYMFWRNSRPDVKRVLLNRAEKEISKIARGVPAPWWKFMHMDFSFNKLVKIDWDDHRSAVQRIIDLSGLRSERLNNLLDSVVRWQELTYDEKIKASNKLYMYSLQFIPRAALFQRFRIVQNELVLTPPEPTDMKESLLKSVANIAEEGDAAIAPSSGSVLATASGEIAAVPSLLMNKNRNVVKRKRNPNLSKLGFRFKDPRTKNDAY